MIVFSTNQLQVVYAEHQSPFLLITFAMAAWRTNQSGFYGSELVERDKISTLGFVATRPNWYPAREVTKAVDSVQPILDRYSERVALGYSMGAYAAIKFARLVGATTSIAISPQYSMNPDDIPEEFHKQLLDFRLVHRVRAADLDQDMRITPASNFGKIIALYDDGDPSERVQITLIEKHVNLTKINMPYTRHATHRCFADAAALSRLVSVCRSGDQAAIRAFSRDQRKTGPGRVLNLIKAATERHLAWAIRLRERYAATLDKREQVALTNLMAETAFRRGKGDWAISTLITAIESGICNTQSQYILFRCYLSRNDLTNAVDVLRGIVAITPRDAWPRERMIEVLLRIPDLAAARAESQKALELFPEHHGLLHFASEIAVRDGNNEQALVYALAASSHDTEVLPRIDRLGHMLLCAGRLEEAESVFAKILRRDPLHPNARRGMSFVQRQLRSFAVSHG